MKKETNEERFKRGAEKRVQNIIKGLRSLAQCSNTKVYAWNKDQLQKIWVAVDKEIEFCKKCFDDPNADLFKL